MTDRGARRSKASCGTKRLLLALGLALAAMFLAATATAWAADDRAAATPPGAALPTASSPTAGVSPPEAIPWYEQMTVMGNEAWRIVALFLTLLVAYVSGRISRAVLMAAAARVEQRGWAYRAILLRTLAQTAILALLAIGLRVGLNFLIVPAPVRSTISTINSMISTLVVAYAAYVMVDLLDAWLMELAKRTTSQLDEMLVPMVRTTLRATIVILAAVQIGTVLSDKPMTSVIAGLGVGGLAVGLAGQEMIKNFFGSLMIFSDRPFEMGSTIDIGGDIGVVESVGFRSTRVRTADGHVVTVPNSLLAAAKVKNVSATPYLKRVVTLSLSYDNKPELISEATSILKALLENHEGMKVERPPRVFFAEFQDNALAVTATYWYSPPDRWLFMAFNDRLNVEILNRFSAAGIQFAQPSRGRGIVN